MPRPDLPIHPNQVVRPAAFGVLRVREDTLYTDQDGNLNAGVRKRAEKLLGKLEAPLQQLLQPDETVLYVARAQTPMSGLEQYTFGWYAAKVSAAVLVVTNKRLLHLLTKTNGAWQRRVRSVRWGDVKEFKVAGFLFSHTLRLKYTSGKSETYWGIQRAPSRKFKLLIPALTAGSQAETSPAGEMTSLCPDCFTALTPGVYQCPQCGLVFKNERSLLWLAFLVPGGGYFYAGQIFLGVMDFLFTSFLLLLVALTALTVAGVLKPEPGEQPVVTFAVVLIILAFEDLVTWWHSRRFVREFIPTGEKRPAGAMAAGVGR